MNDMDQVLYVVKPEDNVGTALSDIKPGKVRLRGGQSGELEVLEEIPFGHKAALRSIPRDEGIIKYAYRVAVATEDIPAGHYVHIHNAKSMHDVRSNTFVSSESGAAVSSDREYTLIGMKGE